MMKLKTLVLVAALALGSLLGAFGLSRAALAVQCPAGSVRPSAGSLAECNLQEDETLMPTLTQIINVIIGVVGVVAVIVIVIGAIFMILSQGDPGKMARARLTIISAIVGLVIAVLAYAIVNFVLSSVFAPKGASAPVTDDPSVGVVVQR